jgi:hypothetical protein
VYGQTKPAGLLSLDTYVEVCHVDMRNWQTLALTLLVTTHDLKWTVYGANLADFSDESVVQAEATVAIGGVGTYVTTAPPFGFYRPKIKANVGGSQGTGTIIVTQKRFGE